jgi:soluble lytic murein transglycosylase-like protein/outer membrane protein assembly factor BamD (BamD/ComL family)
MKKIILILFLFQIILTTISCAESKSEDQWQGPGFYKSPDEIIKTIEKGSSNYNKNFVLAQAYRDKKDLKKSILYYANSAFKSKFNFNMKIYPSPVYIFLKGFSFKSPLYDDAVYEIASLFYQYGEHEYVIKFTDLINEDSSFLYRDSVILKTKSLSRLSEDKKAVAVLNELAEKFTDSNSLALINIRLASIFESIKDYPKASEAYFNIIKANTDTWQDNIAARRLFALFENNSISIKDKEKTILLSTALHEAGEDDKSFSIITLLNDEDHDKDTDIAAVKILTAAKRSEIYPLLNDRKNRPYYDNLVLEHGNTLWDRGARHEAVRRYREIADSDNEEIARRVLVRLIFFYEERSKNEAINLMEKFSKRFPEDELTGRLKWMTGRQYLKDSRYTEASAYFKESIRLFPQGEYSANCRYWLYLIESSEKTLNDDRKNQILEDLCYYNPESAYTLKLLTEEASGMKPDVLKNNYEEARKSNKTKRMHLYHTRLFINEGYTDAWEARINDFGSEITAPYRVLYSRLSSMDLRSKYKGRIIELEKYFRTGNIYAINRELRSIPDNNDEAAIDIAIIMSLFSHQYGHYNYSTHYGFKLLHLLNIKENTALMPKKIAEILYPRSFRECVEKESAAYKVPQNLIYSMIKAESNYIPEAVSSVGAEGLMQLMPATAAGIARQLKITGYNLKNPCTSIKLGANYISWLNRIYNGQIEYIVAGYNAGPGNVNNWIERFKSQNIDYFAEFAPFAETRGYIYRTIKFSVQYKSIYR